MFYIYHRHAGNLYLVGQAKNATTAAEIMEGLRTQMGYDWSDFLITDEEV